MPRAVEFFPLVTLDSRAVHSAFLVWEEKVL